MEVEERVPCEGEWEISLWNSWEKIIPLPRDEEFDSTPHWDMNQIKFKGF